MVAKPAVKRWLHAPEPQTPQRLLALLHHLARRTGLLRLHCRLGLTLPACDGLRGTTTWICPGAVRLILLPPPPRLDVDALEEVLVNEAKLEEQPDGNMPPIAPPRP